MAGITIRDIPEAVTPEIQADMRRMSAGEWNCILARTSRVTLQKTVISLREWSS